jgi:Zn-dependent M28 family amino/carboxypeptidase
VPGANDSASGVAVLLDLIRLFATTPLQPNVGIDFVFFDGEEGEEDIGGDFTHWSPLGSEYFVTQLDTLYDSTENVEGIVLDMVCDKDLEIVPEAFSIEAAPEQVKAFWRIANAVDDDAFGETGSVAVRDDHSALNAAGIPTFLLIDFTYPPFHTTKDTIDKCSAESLATVSEAVYRYVYTLK